MYHGTCAMVAAKNSVLDLIFQNTGRRPIKGTSGELVEERRIRNRVTITRKQELHE